MSKRKIALLSMIGVVLIVAIVIALYIHSIGFNNLKLMQALRTTHKSIIQMEESPDGYGIYLAEVNLPAEMIKERMEDEDWTYVEQNGSGYFFEKDNRKVVVTTKIWNRNFLKITVENNAVNLADAN